MLGSPMYAVLLGVAEKMMGAWQEPKCQQDHALECLIINHLAANNASDPVDASTRICGTCASMSAFLWVAAFAKLARLATEIDLACAYACHADLLRINCCRLGDRRLSLHRWPVRTASYDWVIISA